MKKHTIPGYTLKPRNGYYQVHRIGLSAERVKKEPAFRKTRSNARAFAKAAQVGQQISNLLRQGTGLGIRRAPLNGLLVQLLGAADNARQTNWESLKGFDANTRVPWQETVCRSGQAVYTPDTKQWSLNWPAHNPLKALRLPMGVTHYRIRAAVFGLKAQGEVTAGEWKQTSLFPVKDFTVPRQSLCLPAAQQPAIAQWVFVQVLVYIPAGRREKLIAIKQASPVTVIAARNEVT
jgi:hypothetical protein